MNCSAVANDMRAMAVKATPGMSQGVEKLWVEAKMSRIAPIPARKPSEARRSGADLVAA